MAKLSYTEWGQHAYDAGFRGNDIVTIVAIVFAESGGNSSSVGDGGTSFGGAQIHWSAWGNNLRKAGIASSPEALKNPATNMRAAKYVKDHGSRGFGEWTQYRNGEYKKYEDDVQKAILKKSDEEITEARDLPDPLAGIEATLRTVTGVLIDAGEWIGDPHNWVRILLVAGGIALGLAGISAVASETKAGRAAISGASKGVL